MQESHSIYSGQNLYGLIACGGNSSRMGNDKSMLEYHGKPQCYHLYEMITAFCEQTFISCNHAQVSQVKNSFRFIEDHSSYSNKGPIAALLSAFDEHKTKDILLIGCDYPFLIAEDISEFLSSLNHSTLAAAFYNEEAGMYEPLLSYYNHDAVPELLKMHANNEYSLQHFLKNNNAKKFYPSNMLSMKSIDTMKEFLETKKMIGTIK